MWKIEAEDMETTIAPALVFSMTFTSEDGATAFILNNFGNDSALVAVEEGVG